MKSEYLFYFYKPSKKMKNIDIFMITQIINDSLMTIYYLKWFNVFKTRFKYSCNHQMNIIKKSDIFDGNEYKCPSKYKTYSVRKYSLF